MTKTTNADLDVAFGPGHGQTAEGRARASDRLFVRSIDQIAEFSTAATGRKLTASEALSAYGLEPLVEVGLEGSALLAHSARAAGAVLRQRRRDLNLDVRAVAVRARVTPEVVEACEASRRVSIQTYERIAQALGLDERYLSVDVVPRGNESVSVRLRQIGVDSPKMTQSVVSALAEAAWVAATQGRLEDALGFVTDRHGLTESPNYGTHGYPPFKWGYRLASSVRDALSLEQTPIASMRQLVEETFGFPLIQCELGDAISGATVDTGGRRAIVVNISGQNRNAYVRRATIAHELGHLLFDPAPKLDALRVDDYDLLETSADQLGDPVEQRANAFAVELLAPQEAALSVYRSDGGEPPLTRVMEQFGIGFTAARYQVWNASGRTLDLKSIQAPPKAPPSDLEGRESFTVDYHPIRNLAPSRAGRFSAVVIRAAELKIISWDSAANLLSAPESDVRVAAADVRSLFPSVWRVQ